MLDLSTDKLNKSEKIKIYVKPNICRVVKAGVVSLRALLEVITVTLYCKKPRECFFVLFLDFGF